MSYGYELIGRFLGIPIENSDVECLDDGIYYNATVVDGTCVINELRNINTLPGGGGYLPVTSPTVIMNISDGSFTANVNFANMISSGSGNAISLGLDGKLYVTPATIDCASVINCVENASGIELAAPVITGGTIDGSTITNSTIPASNVTYNNSGTGLSATNAQAAITELKTLVNTINSGDDSVTETIGGHKIAKHTSKNGVIANINETVTSLGAPQLIGTTLYISYTPESGTLQTVSVSLAGLIATPIDYSITTSYNPSTNNTQVSQGGVPKFMVIGNAGEIVCNTPFTTSPQPLGTSVFDVLNESWTKIKNLETSIAGAITTVTDTSTINLTKSGSDISGVVIISPNANNMLTNPGNGLFVSRPTAAQVVVTPNGNLSSTNVQNALQELQGDIDVINGQIPTMQNDIANALGQQGNITESLYYAGENISTDNALFLNKITDENPTIAGTVIGDIEDDKISIQIVGSGVSSNSVGLYLAKRGTPTGNITLRIETVDSNLEPTGTLAWAGATASVAKSSLGSTLVLTTFTLSSAGSLPIGTNAAVVLTWNLDSLTNNVILGLSGYDTARGFVMKRYTDLSSSWADLRQDAQRQKVKDRIWVRPQGSIYGSYTATATITPKDDLILVSYPSGWTLDGVTPPSGMMLFKGVSYAASRSSSAVYSGDPKIGYDENVSFVIGGTWWDGLTLEMETYRVSHKARIQSQLMLDKVLVKASGEQSKTLPTDRTRISKSTYTAGQKVSATTFGFHTLTNIIGLDKKIYVGNAYGSIQEGSGAFTYFVGYTDKTNNKLYIGDPKAITPFGLVKAPIAGNGTRLFYNNTASSTYSLWTDNYFQVSSTPTYMSFVCDFYGTITVTGKAQQTAMGTGGTNGEVALIITKNGSSGVETVFGGAGGYLSIGGIVNTGWSPGYNNLSEWSVTANVSVVPGDVIGLKAVGNNGTASIRHMKFNSLEATCDYSYIGQQNIAIGQ